VPRHGDALFHSDGGKAAAVARMKPSTEELLLLLGARRTALDPARSGAAGELVDLGLAELTAGKDGTSGIRLTGEGRTLRRRLVAKRRRAAPVRQQDLQALEERVVLRISRIIDARIAELEPRLRTMPPAHEQGVVAVDDLGTRVLSALQELDLAQHLDGIVPLRLLRAQLSEVASTALDRVLLQLERQYQIDLKIANDPKAVILPDSGIWLPGRGLAYYAALR